MKNKIFTLVFVLIAINIQSQTTFQKTYGGPGFDQQGSAIQQTTDGGFIIAGKYGYSMPQTILMKTDSLGSLQWEYTYSGINFSHPLTVDQTTDGGYILAGCIDGYNWLFKVDANGAQVFSVSFGGLNQAASAVKETSDGGYIVAGPSNASGWSTSHNIYFIKFDVTGSILWSKNYSGISNDEANSVQQTADGGFVFTGATGSFGAGLNDIVVTKTDAIGNITWSKSYGTSADELGYSIEQTTDGGYIVAAGNMGYECYVLKLDNNGNISWVYKYNGLDGLFNMNIAQTVDGGYIVGGGTGSTGSDFYLLKLASDGNVIWQKNFGNQGESQFEYGYGTRQTSDGGFIMVGASDTTGSLDGNSVYLVKTDNTGNSGCPVHNIDAYADSITFITNSISFSITSGITSTNVIPSFNSITPNENIVCFSDSIA